MRSSRSSSRISIHFKGDLRRIKSDPAGDRADQPATKPRTRGSATILPNLISAEAESTLKFRKSGVLTCPLTCAFPHFHGPCPEEHRPRRELPDPRQGDHVLAVHARPQAHRPDVHGRGADRLRSSAGIFAILLRTMLWHPLDYGASPDAAKRLLRLYNHVFTLHGAVMVFLFIIPAIPAILGNFVLPMHARGKGRRLPAAQSPELLDLRHRGAVSSSTSCSAAFSTRPSASNLPGG